MHVHDSLNLIITLCSRSRCGAREAMTVGCKPTMVRAISGGCAAMLRVAGARLLSLHNPVAHAARALAGRYTGVSKATVPI